MKKKPAQILPMIGTEPVTSVPPCLIELTLDGKSRVMGCRHLSGPTSWVKGDGPPWTGYGIFSLSNELLHVYGAGQRLAQGHRLNVVFGLHP